MESNKDFLWGRRLDDNFRPAAPLRRSLRRLQNSELLECSRAVIKPDLLRDFDRRTRAAPSYR